MPCKKLVGKLVAYTDTEIAIISVMVGDFFVIETPSEILKIHYKKLGYGHKRIVAILKHIYGNKCLCCGEEKPLAVDRIIHKRHRLKGTNDLRNLQLLCIKCNNKKGNKITDYRPFNIEEKIT